MDIFYPYIFMGSCFTNQNKCLTELLVDKRVFLFICRLKLILCSLSVVYSPCGLFQ